MILHLALSLARRLAIGVTVGLMACLPSVWAATKSWKTDGPSSNWSNPDNWYGGVPQNGDVLHFFEFNDLGTDPSPMVNDLTGLVVDSMVFLGRTSAAGDIEWTLSGNTITLSNHVSPEAIRVRQQNDTDTILHLNCNVILAKDAQFQVGGCNPTEPTDPCAADDVVQKLFINGQVDLNGHDLELFGAAAFYPDSWRSSSHVEVGHIAGSGNVSVLLDPDCSLYFVSPNGNSFQGRLTISGDTGSRTALAVSGGVAVTDSLLVRRNSLVECSSANQIGDSASLAIVGEAMFKLNGYNDTIGSLALTNVLADGLPATVDTGAGTLTVNGNLTAHNDNASVTPVIAGRLGLASGQHTFHEVGSAYHGVDIAAQISGAGGILKTGNSALLLRGSNIFNGNVVIQQGIVEVRHARALGDLVGYTSLGAGALLLRNVNVAAEPLRADGQGVAGEMPGSVLTSIGLCSWAGQVVLNTNLVVNGDLAFTGPITGTGGMGLFGGGTVQFGGNLPNTFSGPTLVRCPMLELNKSPFVKAVVGPLIVGGGPISSAEVRWLQNSNTSTSVTVYENGILNLNGRVEGLGPLTLIGGNVNTGAGELGLYGPVTVESSLLSPTISGTVRLPPGLTQFHVSPSPAYYDLAVGANIIGTGNLGKFGYGELWLIGANTYSGSTIVYEGTLIASTGAALGSGNGGTAVLPGATLRLNANGEIVTESISINGSGLDGYYGALNVQGNVTLRNPLPSIYPCLDLTTNATVRVEAGAQLTADGFISGTGPLIKSGPGKMVMTGGSGSANTYSGATVVKEGTLELNKANVVSVPGSLIIGPASVSSPAVLRFNQAGGLATTTPTVNANSLLDLNNYDYTVTQLYLNDGGDVQTGGGTLYLASGSAVSVGSSNLLGSVASSSISGTVWAPQGGSTTLSVAAYSPNAPLGLPPELDVSANVLGAFSPAVAFLSKTGAGAVRFRGNNNTYWSRLRVFDGTFIAAHATAFGSASANTTVNNDATLALEGGITIANEALTLNSIGAAALDSRTGANTWSGSVSLLTNSAISVSQSLSIPVAITGTGDLTKRGAGTLTFSGATNNSYAGNTIIEAGTLALAKSGLIQAVPSNLIIGQPGGPAATALYQNHDQVWADITVTGNGLLNLNGFDEYAGNLTLNEGGDVQTLTGSLYVNGTNGVTVNPGTDTTSTISGRLGFDDGLRTITVNSNATAPGVFNLEVPAVIFRPSGHRIVHLTKAGAGRARFSANNTYTGTNTLSGGVLQIDGSQPQTPVYIIGGRLQGTGAVGHITYGASPTAFVAPGASPGMLTCSNYMSTDNTRGRLETELNGPNPGTQYDQVNVRGTVRLSGITLVPSLNFLSSTGQTFVIIANDGADSVVGTFIGRPQGSSFWLGSELFQISYTGGTGNDVVLTRLATPPLVLRIEGISQTNARLSWSTNYPDYHLESNLDLVTTNWAAVLESRAVSGTNFVVTNAAVMPKNFYRLSRLPVP